jgi:uroporphyrinogen III methyltransferase/synthase
MGSSERNDRPGFVSLVGAGPGDPGLITVKGLQRLREAEVVVYDRLANDALLAEVPDSAQRIFAGKGPGDHALSQDQINELLVCHGIAGKRVVRLKGGDPFVFGRGGEEAEALVAAGIRFEVVPGVTSAIAAPAYAGIPVTHRDFTTAFTVVTGHEDPEKGESTIPWQALAQGPDTVVFLMGVGRIESIASHLITAGRAGTTPAAVVRRGTWPDQQVVLGTLEDIASRVRDAGLTPPAVTVVGRVASLARVLHWYQPSALAGRRVLVTRARDQASSLTTLLQSYGAKVVEFPAIRILPADDYAALDAALRASERYHWICFTSVNAVSAVGARLDVAGISWADLRPRGIAAIGPATRDALAAQGVRVDYMPDRFLAEAIAEGLPGAEGARILLARADIADRRLVDALVARGATVDQFTAYRTVVSGEDAGALRDAFLSGAIDVVTFASSSTVRNLCSALGDNAGALLAGSTIACIGPVTAETAVSHGLTPAVVASEHTIAGLVTAIEEYLAHEH